MNNDSSRHAASHKGPVIALVIALAVVSGAAGGGIYCYQRTETAQSAEARHLVTYANEQALVDETMMQAKTILDGNEQGEGVITSEQVADASVLDALRDTYDEHKDASLVEPNDAPTGSWSSMQSLSDWFDFWAVEQSLKENESIRSYMQEERQAVEDAIFAVETSKRQKDVSDSHNKLADVISSAEASLDTVRGEVSDEGTVTALEEQLENAKAVRDEDLAEIRYTSQSECDSQVETYKNAAAALTEAQTKAEDSHANWQAVQKREAEYASQQTAQRAAQQTGGYAAQTSDGTWYVSYRGTDDPTTANADGSLSVWKDGYYIAHQWSSNGQMIKSKPSTVVVNGRTYRYVSSITVPLGTQWSEISGFVYANGGIGFQTCVGGGNALITHYEPM